MNTITIKELQQGEYVTRTVKASAITVKLINTETYAITEETVTLSGTYAAEYCENTVEKKFGAGFKARSLKIIKVAAVAETEDKIAVRLADFLTKGIRGLSASELQQGEYVTRTVKASAITVKLINTETYAITEETVTLSGTYAAEYCENTVEKKFGAGFKARNLKIIKVAGVAETEDKVAMKLADFIECGYRVVPNEK